MAGSEEEVRGTTEFAEYTGPNETQDLQGE
jgi:hypothetical protein